MYFQTAESLIEPPVPNFNWSKQLLNGERRVSYSRGCRKKLEGPRPVHNLIHVITRLASRSTRRGSDNQNNEIDTQRFEASASHNDKNSRLSTQGLHTKCAYDHDFINHLPIVLSHTPRRALFWSKTMATMRANPRLQVGSALWISEERASALQIAEAEAEEFVFSARNEVEWLNEHMAEIFSNQNLCVNKIVKMSYANNWYAAMLPKSSRLPESYAERPQGQIGSWTLLKFAL